MANRRGRPSHLDADTAEQGLEMYMEVCGSSGLPNVARIARSYKAMPKAKRLDRYIAEFEDEASWGEAEAEADAVNWDGDEGDDLDGLRQQVARLTALLEDREGGESMAKTQTAPRRNRRNAAPAPEGFVKGTTFTYANQNGDVSEHTIVRVAGGRVFTDTDKRFKISTLEQLNGDVVNIV